jgi:hypothetical protein
MIPLMLLAQLVSSAPPLRPERALEVFRKAVPDLDRSSIVYLPQQPEGPMTVVVPYKAGDGPFGSFPPRKPLPPLNCCSVLSVPLPYPTLILRERPTADRGKR